MFVCMLNTASSTPTACGGGTQVFSQNYKKFLPYYNFASSIYANFIRQGPEFVICFLQLFTDIDMLGAMLFTLAAGGAL